MSNDERDRHLLDQDLRDLQVLDPAREARPGAGREPGAQALLDRVLHEPQGSTSPGEVGRVRDRRRVPRWALAGTIAAALAAGLVAVPPWGTPEQQAFATWTPVPQDVPADSLDEVGAQCTNRLARDVLEQEVVIAEERGRVTFVVTRTPYSFRHCLLVDGEPGMSGGGSMRNRSAEVAPTDVQTFLATGGGGGEDAYTAITGRAGEDVAGVKVHPRGPVTEPGALPGGELPQSVTATIDNGHYGAWWPGINESFELTIHLADGTVLPRVPAFDR
ncbi:hypothetical protein PU560_11085 [Georgenia sp. 10Sc9-8]|uniref:DUF4179 domain-containing protein n=1 Tax=Georgenia halotolerans TaxID=3028317 RepID=A0ABT5TY63_9MICO|nr:hypothetical protein [Georgenia halotolerans]